MTLKEWLHEKRLSATAFAAQNGLTPSTVTRYLNGSRKPSAKLALDIEQFTGGAVTKESVMWGDKA